jgi:predicted SnoaL-like aldol condensation-catalyzing enzyme
MVCTFITPSIYFDCATLHNIALERAGELTEGYNGCFATYSAHMCVVESGKGWFVTHFARLCVVKRVRYD